MRGIDRLNGFGEEDFDKIIMQIRNGKIKSGRYAHLVKVDKDKKINIDGKELFKNDGTNS